jgi:hypothetical protein
MMLNVITVAIENRARYKRKHQPANFELSFLNLEQIRKHMQL